MFYKAAAIVGRSHCGRRRPNRHCFCRVASFGSALLPADSTCLRGQPRSGSCARVSREGEPPQNSSVFHGFFQQITETITHFTPPHGLGLPEAGRQSTPEFAPLAAPDFTTEEAGFRPGGRGHEGEKQTANISWLVTTGMPALVGGNLST